MTDILFVDWLHEQEWHSLLALLNENLDAASASNNHMLTSLIGVPYNWYGVAIQAAAQYVKGQDILIVVNDLIEHLVKSLKNPTNSLAQSVAKVKDNPDELTKLISTGIRLRARRFAEQFNDRKSKMTVNMSALQSKDNTKSFDPASLKAPAANQFNIEELKKAVIEELKKMASEAGDKRSQERLMFAAEKVAPERMENAPDLVPMDVLLAKFPDVSRGSMHNIINDIQKAFARVASKFGMEGILGSINRLGKVG